MRARIAILALCAVAAATAAGADERLLDASLRAPAPAGPAVGVERSSDLRMAEPRRGFFVDNPEPLSFQEQINAGLRAFHLVVYADPDVGRYARGHAQNVSELKRPGLKVVDPASPDHETVCVTLMLCLQSLDAVAAATGERLVVVVEARAAPRPRGRVRRVMDALFDHPPAAPGWDALLNEVATALPDLDPARLAIVLTGGEGERPAPESVLGARGASAVALDGANARVLGPYAAPVTVSTSVASGAFTVVLGADWTGETDRSRLGPREAARLGAQVVIVTPETARAGAM